RSDFPSPVRPLRAPHPAAHAVEARPRLSASQAPLPPIPDTHGVVGADGVVALHELTENARPGLPVEGRRGRLPVEYVVTAHVHLESAVVEVERVGQAQVRVPDGLDLRYIEDVGLGRRKEGTL